MLLSNILGFIIALLLWPIAKTWRYHYYLFDGHNTREIKKKKELPPARVFALLHGEQLPLLIFNPCKHLAAICSKSKDGEIAARVLKLLSVKPIRGSSHHGGQEALEKAAEYVKEGGELAITVDGPRGPRGTCKRGVVLIAKAGAVPIQPVVARAQSCRHLHSWDRFMLPRPFSRLNIIYGPLLQPNKEAHDEEIFALCQEIAATLQKMEELSL